MSRGKLLRTTTMTVNAMTMRERRKAFTGNASEAGGTCAKFKGQPLQPAIRSEKHCGKKWPRFSAVLRGREVGRSDV